MDNLSLEWFRMAENQLTTIIVEKFLIFFHFSSDVSQEKASFGKQLASKAKKVEGLRVQDEVVCWWVSKPFSGSSSRSIFTKNTFNGCDITWMWVVNWKFDNPDIPLRNRATLLSFLNQEPISCEKLSLAGNKMREKKVSEFFKNVKKMK